MRIALLPGNGFSADNGTRASKCADELQDPEGQGASDLAVSVRRDASLTGAAVFTLCQDSAAGGNRASRAARSALPTLRSSRPRRASRRGTRPAPSSPEPDAAAPRKAPHENASTDRRGTDYDAPHTAGADPEVDLQEVRSPVDGTVVFAGKGRSGVDIVEVISSNGQ